MYVVRHFNHIIVRCINDLRLLFVAHNRSGTNVSPSFWPYSSCRSPGQVFVATGVRIHQRLQARMQPPPRCRGPPTACPAQDRWKQVPSWKLGLQKRRICSGPVDSPDAGERCASFHRWEHVDLCQDSGPRRAGQTDSPSAFSTTACTAGFKSTSCVRF